MASYLIVVLFIWNVTFVTTSNPQDTWIEEIGEEHSSVILPHYELDDYEDNGNWSEDITDVVGNASGILRWVRELGNLSREEGESVRLRCEAVGEPDPITIKWLRNEAPIDSGLGPVGKRRLSFRTTQSTHKANSRLRIPRLEVHDSGFYTCKARNGAGRVISTTGLLKVRMTPFALCVRDGASTHHHCDESGKLLPVHLTVLLSGSLAHKLLHLLGYLSVILLCSVQRPQPRAWDHPISTESFVRPKGWFEVGLHPY